MEIIYIHTIPPKPSIQASGEFSSFPSAVSLVDQIGKSVPVYSLVKDFVKIKAKFSANVLADLADGVVKVKNAVIFVGKFFYFGFYPADNAVLFLYLVFKRSDLFGKPAVIFLYRSKFPAGKRIAIIPLLSITTSISPGNIRRSS